MIIFQTQRLAVRQFRLDDAAFVLSLITSPPWLRFIGDRGITTLESAREYLNGTLKGYATHGFGLWLVEVRDGALPVGMCGLVKRAGLADVDIGFAFLESHWGLGYAHEAAAATVAYARGTLSLKRLVALTTADNTRSAKLLTKLGMQLDKTVMLADDPEPLRLFALALQS